ncbi:MAG TPA: hypothetical protein VG406_20405 [Isosphaeraceae bacterium]|jgi:uncharacterized protein (TIGR03067 family)|nr:hypothetical protein [Isosphaeraceae bacterium]
MLRVRLSTLLLLVAIAAVGVAWYAEARRRARLEADWRTVQQELIVRRLERAIAVQNDGFTIRMDSIAGAWKSVESADDAAERKRIAGTWALVATEEGRKPPAGGPSILGIDPNGVLSEDSAAADGSPPHRRAYYRVVSGTDPAAIDQTTDDLRRPILKGIYRLDGETLTICWGRSGDRPADFRPGKDRRLLTYRRKGP